jgi:hypothetical protein
MASMNADPSYFSAADFDAARKRLLDARALSLDSAIAMVDELAYWWASASVNYFLGFPASLAASGPGELAAFLDVYVMRNFEVAAVRMNPADYAKEGRAFAAALFQTIGPDNAFWWQQ